MVTHRAGKLGSIEAAGLSPFCARVLAEVSNIPAGRVATYSQIARLIGSKSPRAVGGALRQNPDAPTIPCHRVVRSDGHLGGYFGQTSEEALAAKRRILEQEGISFDDRGRVLPEHF